MRYWIILSCAALTACSSQDQPKSPDPKGSAVGAAEAAVDAAKVGKDAPLQKAPSADDDSTNWAAPCMTEESLREANASEEEIKEFREAEAAAKVESGSTCG